MRFQILPSTQMICDESGERVMSFTGQDNLGRKLGFPTLEHRHSTASMPAVNTLPNDDRVRKGLVWRFISLFKVSALLNFPR